MRHLTIENYKQFSEVEEEDKVTFEFNDNTYNYTVESRYLESDDDINSKILKVLEIEDRCKFCSEAYGYSAEDVGDLGFPECEYEDYEALLRVICAIFEKIKESTKSSNILEEIIKPTSLYIKL